MASIKNFLIFLVSLTSFVYTFYVVGRLMLFLSSPKAIPKAYIWVFNLLDNKSRLQTAYGPIVYNTFYTIAFIFQHSLMKSSIYIKFLNAFGLASAERAIYSLTSSYCLHLLISNWSPAQSIVFWQINVEENILLWWSFVLLHSFAWIVIYGGSIIMDLPDIIGMKQAYYAMKGLPSSSMYKSKSLRQLHDHVRHPSFTGLSIVLWATNLMTIDRLLLSIVLTTYMYVAWSTSKQDLKYQQLQLQRKSEELKAF